MQGDIAPLTKFRAAIILFTFYRKGTRPLTCFRTWGDNISEARDNLETEWGGNKSKPDCHKKAKSGIRFSSPLSALSGVAERERPFIKQPRGRDKGHAAQPQKSIKGEAKVGTYSHQHHFHKMYNSVNRLTFHSKGHPLPYFHTSVRKRALSEAEPGGCAFNLKERLSFAISRLDKN